MLAGVAADEWIPGQQLGILPDYDNGALAVGPSG